MRWYRWKILCFAWTLNDRDVVIEPKLYDDLCWYRVFGRLMLCVYRFNRRKDWP